MKYVNKETQYNEAICWGKHGDTILITDEGILTELLPFFFKTKSYISFVRQLNSYTFRKVSERNKPCEYKNPHFRKGEMEKIHFIERKKDKKRHERKKEVLIKNEINDYQAKTKRITKHINDLEDSIVQIQEANNKIGIKMAEFKYHFDNGMYSLKKEATELLDRVNQKCREQFNNQSIFFPIDWRDNSKMNQEERHLLVKGKEIFPNLLSKVFKQYYEQHNGQNYVLEQTINFLREKSVKGKANTKIEAFKKKASKCYLFCEDFKEHKLIHCSRTTTKQQSKFSNPKRIKKDFSFLFKRKETNETGFEYNLEKQDNYF